MHLRTARPDDLHAIASLHAESWRTAYRGIYPDTYLDGDLVADRVNVWRPRLESPSDEQFTLLVFDGKELLGLAFAIGNADDRWGTLLDNLHVRRGHQGRGLGRALLGRTAAWSHQRYPGAPFHLWVLDANTRARRFYELLGGRPHESEDHTPPGGVPTKGWRYVWDSPEPLLPYARDAGG